MGETVLINGPEVVTSYSVELVPLFRYEVDVADDGKRSNSSVYEPDVTGL